MPFTFAHPAIVLPLSRAGKGFSMTALVVGSMMPDFEYFLRLKVESKVSHTLMGLVVFDVPLGLAFYFIYIRVYRNHQSIDKMIRPTFYLL